MDWLWSLWVWGTLSVVWMALPFLIVWWARKDYKKPPVTFKEQQRRIYSRRK